MDLLSLLEDDPFLRSFFNAYLAHPIFPVSLTYDTKLNCVVERDRPTTASRDDVAAWVMQERYICFRRSRFYIQYHLFEQLWRANGGAFHAGDAHAALLNFKMFLDTTVGGAVVVAWEELQLCKGSKENAELTEAKRRCLSTLPIPHSGTNTWAEVWEASALERLRSYWLPSYVTSSQQRVPTARDDYPLVALHSDPCCVALMDERDMGAPLGHYLQRHGTGEELSALKVWEECMRFRNLKEEGGPVQSLRRSFSSLWAHIRSTERSLLSDLSVTMAASWNAVEAGSWNEVCDVLGCVQEHLFPILKGVWSRYRMMDYAGYKACFRVVLDDAIAASGPQNSTHPATLHPTSTAPKVHSRKRAGVRYAELHKGVQAGSLHELLGSPIDALADMNTLGAYVKYLTSHHGPLSQEHLAYQLWFSIVGYRKLPKLKKASRDDLASKIYRTYLFHDSPKRVELPECVVAQLPSYAPHYRPRSSTLRSVQVAAADIFAPTVTDFLQRSNNGTYTPSPVLDEDKPHLGQQPAMVVPTSEDIRQLSAALELAGGPPSQQLKNFASFLQSSATGAANLLHFWLEAHRFKGMFKEGLHMNTLCSKAEALLNTFLDTAAPTVAIPSGLVQQMQRAGEELRKSRNPQTIECFCEILTQAQEKAFCEMLPHWKAFGCHGFQQRPVISKVALPKVMNRCPPPLPSRKSTSNISTCTTTAGRSSLLTFSQLKGIEWKAPIDL